MKSILLILHILCYLPHPSSAQQQRQQDVSAYPCHTCLQSPQQTFFWCTLSQATGTAGQCCSGSNFFWDKCSASLRASPTCTKEVADPSLRYGACPFDKGVCGNVEQVIEARQGVTRVQIPGQVRGTIAGGRGPSQGAVNTVCSYKVVVRELAAEQLVVRFTLIKEAIIYASIVQGSSAFDTSVGKSQEITQSGSYRFQIEKNTQTLILSIILKDPVKSQVIFETYTLGHYQYDQQLKWITIIIFSSTFGLYLFLVMTQKCRIVIQKHESQIQDYLNRKQLYKHFEKEDLFRRQRQLESVPPLSNKQAPPGYDTYYRNERGQLVPVKSAMLASLSRLTNNQGDNFDHESVSQIDAEASQNMKRILNLQLPQIDNSLQDTLGQQTLQSTRGAGKMSGLKPFFTQRNLTPLHAHSNKIAPAEIIQPMTDRNPYQSRQKGPLNINRGLYGGNQISDGPSSHYYNHPNGTDFSQAGDPQHLHMINNESPRWQQDREYENYQNTEESLMRSLTQRKNTLQPTSFNREVPEIRESMTHRNGYVPQRNMPILRKRLEKGQS